ncbi:hypothetical protein, partial [Paraglaciecola hydrolytica]|uniref:hypothetical protein n=1 Tax=Paraglaciecola hydrolytica TaxID=1799789 RepID=UPI001F483543
WVDESREVLLSKSLLEFKQNELIQRQEKIDIDRDKLKFLFEEMVLGFVEYKNPATLPVSWLQAVESLAKEANISITNRKPDTVLDITESISVFSGQVVLRGNASNILDFLLNVETSKFLRLRAVDVRKNTRALTDEMILDVEVLMLSKRV